MNEIRRFIEWLSFHPSSDDIARALVTDYLSDLGVCCMRFGRINNDDSAIALGQYGYADADQWRNLVVPGTEWRNWDLPAIDIMTGKNKSRWAPDSKLCVITLRDRGVDQERGMVEGKTNHELATEMGFSVSFIRHETMRIHRAAPVNDRLEVA